MFLFVLKAHFLLWGLSIHFRTLIKFTRHHHQFTYLDRAQNLAAFHEISNKHFTENWGQSQDLVKFFIDLGRVSGRDKPTRSISQRKTRRLTLGSNPVMVEGRA